MSMDKLRYLSSHVFDNLRENVTINLARYLEGDFTDLAEAEGWAIPLTFEADLEPLKNLKPGLGPDVEVVNSLLVWQSLSRLPPALANEGRLWARLVHVEALPYARARWVGERSGQAAEEAINKHFFGETRTRCRDDNAIGRLWWNAYIARLAMPENHQLALKAILRTADIRSNIIERAWISSRPRVAAAIVRAILRNRLIAASEIAFRGFMKRLNRQGGGVLFEAMSDGEVDALMDACATRGT
jgi:hypothetical protein